jgi:hypothetical protein
MADIAFKASFRITDNRNRKTEKAPEQNISVDFTPDQAIAAANWLMTAAENAERNSSKIRVYKGLNDFEEVTGFTLWGGLWGQKGSFSPLQHESDLPF